MYDIPTLNQYKYRAELETDNLEHIEIEFSENYYNKYQQQQILKLSVSTDGSLKLYMKKIKY